jgi:hypothetical protein
MKVDLVVAGRAAFVIAMHAAAFVGCGGGSAGRETTGPSTPTSPTPPPATTPPVVASACDSMGEGTVHAQCGRSTMTFFGAVDRAIDQLIRQQPGIFNLGDVAGERSYRVTDTDAYYQGLTAVLGAGGLCAQMDATKSYLQVKGSNDFSEDYEVLTSKGFTPLGVWIYRDTCTPASFPVSAADTISYIRISFFGFNCNPGVAAPDKAAKKLPMGCDGYLTATPKDPDGRDVPSQIHGSEISWSFKRGEEFVSLRQWPDQPFNQTVHPVAPGFFKLCANVQGVSDCVGIEVVP